MALMQLIIGLVVLGVALWIINTLLPMDEKIKAIINVIVLVVVLIWLVRYAGLW